MAQHLQISPMVLVYNGGTQEVLHAATLRLHACNLKTVTQMLERVQQVAQLEGLPRQLL